LFSEKCESDPFSRKNLSERAFYHGLKDAESSFFLILISRQSFPESFKNVGQGTFSWSKTGT
jgi:hypothetical protein